ncbi:glutathione S-transferase family protein [Paraburkholderia sacchari]|uniref:glutathione S-transferase family protein n=1 Tax=Paraburkholderia sacchari TaxID=159450 RepID=UPI001BCE4ED9|nr:glutathione S-transferase [Paraburkholderia sacchari]
MSKEYKLHCFAQSGSAYKVALMLACSGVDWEPVFVDFFHGQTRGADWRASTNEMGEVPVLEHAGNTLTQSGVILDYLADRLGTFAAQNENEKREILRWILFDNHKFTSYIASYRYFRSFATTPQHPEVQKFLKGRAEAAYSIVETHLAQNEYIVGKRPTIADLSLAGYVFYPAEETGFDLPSAYPNIARWAQRIANLPGWKDPYELMPGERIAPRNV